MCMCMCVSSYVKIDTVFPIYLPSSRRTTCDQSSDRQRVLGRVHTLISTQGKCKIISSEDKQSNIQHQMADDSV